VVSEGGRSEERWKLLRPCSLIAGRNAFAGFGPIKTAPESYYIYYTTFILRSARQEKSAATGRGLNGRIRPLLHTRTYITAPFDEFTGRLLAPIRLIISQRFF